MTIADRWLLPDGVEEILPHQAWCIESLRRELLDLYRSWGYELVMPPLIEFAEALLIGLGSDVDLATFKLTDQITGRTLALRADITPQTARIDAHSLRRDGITRLCYVGNVVHTRPRSLLASRTPFVAGAELYGSDSLDADAEVIGLMLQSLKTAGLATAFLDLGHVGIYRTLVNAAAIDADAERLLFDALQRKAVVEVAELVDAHVADKTLATMLKQLVQLNGDSSVLATARKVLASAPAAVLAAIDLLQQVADRVSARLPQVTLYFDLAELPGYHYHTGLVFAAFVPGYGQAVANGGRYDDIGAVFGRARPATGFSFDLKALISLTAPALEPARAIAAPAVGDAAMWSAVDALRADGEQVLVMFDSQLPVACDRELKLVDGRWQLLSLAAFIACK
jgi:ATP phosphoribosyltransferase regulatory subunit